MCIFLAAPCECVCLKGSCLLGIGRQITKLLGETQLNLNDNLLLLSFMFFFASTVSDFHKSHFPISIGWLDDIGLPQYKDLSFMNPELMGECCST